MGSEADISDTENVMASPGLVDYAVERGWHDPSSGESLSFKKAFSPPSWEGSFKEKYGGDPRQWYAQCLVKEANIDLESENELPDLYYKPGDIEEEMNLNRHFDYPEQRFEFDPHFALDVFNALENLVDIDYEKAIKIVRSEGDPFEQLQFAVQPIVEETALKIYEKDKKLAEEFLTDYSLSRATLALYKAKQLVNKLKMIYWRH